MVNFNKEAHDNAEQDACSPFCICTCCATLVQLSFTSVLSFVSWESYTLLLTPYLEHIVVADTLTIWQPPKA